MLLFTLAVAEFNLCNGFSIDPYRPMPLKQANPGPPETNVGFVNHGPTLVQSSFGGSERDCSDCEKLAEYVEALTHAYYGPTSSAAERLHALRSKFGHFLEHDLSEDVVCELSQYEALCRCVSKRVRSGLSLREIYARRLCGDATTRAKRMEILARCRGRSRTVSHK
jgi:hypothetical protein